MVGVGVGTFRLFAHMPYLERQDRETVQSPGRRLGIDCRIRKHLDILVLLAVPCVDLLDHVRAHLIRAVDAPLQLQSLRRIDLRIADYILQMPLHGINPVFGIQNGLERTLGIRILAGGVDIVGLMVIADTAVKHGIGVID